MDECLRLLVLIFDLKREREKGWGGGGEREVRSRSVYLFVDGDAEDAWGQADLRYLDYVPSWPVGGRKDWGVREGKGVGEVVEQGRGGGKDVQTCNKDLSICVLRLY